MRPRKSEPRSSSSCAACKLLKRRCCPTCIFAPHFRADEANKFAKLHKVFGASNVSKILSEVPAAQREDAVNSLSYEAEARLRDPVYGCIGAIAQLQLKTNQLQHDLATARARLAAAAASFSSSSSSSSSSYSSATPPPPLPPPPPPPTPLLSDPYDDDFFHLLLPLCAGHAQGFHMTSSLSEDLIATHVPNFEL